MLIALVFLMSIGTVLLLVAVLAMRQQLYRRRRALAPFERFERSRGEQGERAPVLSVPTLNGAVLTIGRSSRDGRFQLLLFIEARSDLCDLVAGQAVELCRAAGIRLLLLGEGAAQDYDELRARHAIDAHDFVLNGDVGEDFLIGSLPSAALLDPQGHIIARGTVQRREQLEMLLLPAERQGTTTQGNLH